MGSNGSSNLERRVGIGVENPFAFKVGQVFTGFGVGCGVGIGIGRPLNLVQDGQKPRHASSSSLTFPIVSPVEHFRLITPRLILNRNSGIGWFEQGFGEGAIPALQQVTSAARGATDVFSAFGRHVNSSLRRFGAKNIEAGIGCGVGFGHGFGVGLAIKPGVLYHLQSYIGEALMKMMMKFGVVPSLSNGQSMLPSYLKSSLNSINDTNMQSPIGNIMQMASKSPGHTTQGQFVDVGTDVGSIHEPFVSKRAPSKTSVGSCSEQVISNFLHNPLLKDEEDLELKKLVLRHQQIINELMDENEKFREVLIEDLKIPPNKLQASNTSRAKSVSPCSNCLECRRRRRKHR